MLHLQATGVIKTEGKQQTILLLHISGADTYMFNCFQLKQVGKLLIVQNLWFLLSTKKK